VKRIEAQFRPRRRPGRMLLATLSVLVVFASLAVAGAVLEHHRVVVLRAQIAQLVEDSRTGVLPPTQHPTPLYEASAQQFLRERSAGWASMLRTLENASMMGVTPSSVEFDAVDGTARVELNYSDSTALFDYLGRINEGVSPAQGVARWSLVETRVQPTAGAANGVIPTGQRNSGAESIASIRSVWLDPSVQAAP